MLFSNTSPITIILSIALLGLSITFILSILVLILTILRKKRYPEKSFYNNFLNVALTPMRTFRLGPFKQGNNITLEKAIKYAIRKTKLNDLGDSTFMKNYSVILDTPAHKSLKLTNLGYIMYRLEMNMTMVRRLKLIEYLKQNPSIKDIPVRSPVFVMGMPRTGTTFLHRLLSLDPAVRSPLLWELLAPIPSVSASDPQEIQDRDINKRAKFIRKLIQTRKSMGDNALEHIHEVGADLPEECIMSLTDVLPLHMSLLYSVYINHKAFFSIPSKDIEDAYAYYKDVLRILSNQIGDKKGEKRWVLKCPVHVFFVKEIMKVYPDAKIIWTHRHPISAVPSMCSLVKSLYRLYYVEEGCDDNLLGKSIKEVTYNYLDEIPKMAKKEGIEMKNVLYEDLVKDPIQLVKTIYAENGWEFTDEYNTILKDFLAEDKKKRDQIKKDRETSNEIIHHYTPQEFGLTEEELSVGNFDTYVKNFNVPLPKKGHN